MSFIVVGIQKDRLGRPCEVSIDTDDLSDELYSEYCKAKRNKEKADDIIMNGKRDVAKLLGFSVEDANKEYNMVMRRIKQQFGL